MTAADASDRPEGGPARPRVPARPAARDGFFAWHGIWAPGVRLFRRIGFGAKAVIVSLAFLVPLIALLGWQMHERDRDAMQARKAATRQHVEIAHGVIAWAHSEEKAGRLTTQAAQTLATQMLASMRYDKAEYFWINDMHPRMVMHPIKPELDGTDLTANRDPNGFALFQGFVRKVRESGEGFVPYQWPKPGKTEAVDKVSYVKGFEPWGWIVGSGIYVDDLREVTMRNLAWTIAEVLVAMSIAAYMFYCFYLVMDGGLRETRSHLSAMADGDLTLSPSPWGRDEAAVLMLDLAHMQASMRRMVSRVRQSSDEIVHSSRDIASDANDLSARTEQSVANLEQSAASMEQISATVKSTSDHTAEASRVAGLNAQVAAAGGRAMAEVISTMEAIRASSNRIAEIIGTIDGIAFQTNILALNAAVEAARAGDQGRGFAVVAGEVRTLAQRSADAARQIKTLIGDSVGQVEASADVVRKAGTTIEEIVAASQRVSQLLGDIAQGSREQTLGIGQVGQAVQELDQLSQQNAGLVEKTVSAAQKLQAQADTLAAEVARFRLPA
ncbi:MAG: methyl-accepting chemotaxis protein [Lautropia sp.]